jgi:hypothetical protein
MLKFKAQYKTVASLPKYDSIKNAKKKSFPIEGDRIRQQYIQPWPMGGPNS